MKKFLATVLAVMMMVSVMAVNAFAETTLTGQSLYECANTDEDHTCEAVEEGYPSCYVEVGVLSTIGDGNTLEPGNDYTIDVIGKLDSNNDGIPDDGQDPVTPADPTIAVDIYWTDMVFCYSQSWDEVNLTYVWNWTNGEDYIRVDNRSSVGVDASVTFTGEDEYGDDAVEFAFDEESAVAAAWADNTLTLGYGNQATEEQLAEDETTVVTPSGTLNVNVAATTTMDTAEGAATEVTLGQITVNVSKVVEETTPSEPEVEVPEELGTFQFDTESSDRGTYSVIAGKTYTLIYYEAKDCSISITSVTDASGDTVADTDFVTTDHVDGGDDATGYSSYMTFTCGEALVGETITLTIQGEADGYKFTNTLTLYVVAE